MKERVTKYKCDNNCKVEVTLTTDNYPFEDGWVIIRNLSIGIPMKDNNSVKPYGDVILNEPKHFCSKKCFSDFLIREIKSAEVMTSEMEHFDGDEATYDKNPELEPKKGTVNFFNPKKW